MVMSPAEVGPEYDCDGEGGPAVIVSDRHTLVRAVTTSVQLKSITFVSLKGRETASRKVTLTY
jgi:hypothetical protein